jgi:hypothetical protein
VPASGTDRPCESYRSWEDASGSDLGDYMHIPLQPHVVDQEAALYQLDCILEAYKYQIATMDHQLELSEVGTAATHADQPHPQRSSTSAHRRQTILISMGCGVLQLPIWGVQPLTNSV